MRTLFLLAGAAALVGASPALAKPGEGKGHGPHAVKVKTAKVKTATIKPAKIGARTWLTACPPGLVWRGPTCLPPGQNAKILAVGTRVPRGWSYTPWAALSPALREGLSDDFRYIRRGDFIYTINPQTRRIISVVAIP